MRSSQLIENLNTAARQNPVAAGLIGLGLAWVVLGRSGVAIGPRSVARTAKRGFDAAVDAASGAVTGAASQIQAAAGGIKDAVSQGVEAAGASIGEAVEGLKSTYRPPGQRSEFQRHFPASTSSRLTDLLDRQPLALAALGIAIGAAVASAFPASEVEDRILGPSGDTLKATLADATDAMIERTGAAIDGAIDEATAQDLTPEAMKNAVRDGAERVKAVADAGLDALKTYPAP